MGLINQASVTRLLAELDAFAVEYPASPCKKAAAVINQLLDSYHQLIDRQSSGPSAKPRPLPRVRRPQPKMPHGTPAHEKILANIIKNEETGCWIWAGTGDNYYGRMRDENNKWTYCHRIMYEHANRCKIKPGLCVRHTCDNGFCVNPEHLIIGTRFENMQDRSSRGRHGSQKLLPVQAKQILIRYRKGESASVLAKEFGVTAMNVRNIGSVSFLHLNDDPDVRAIPIVKGQLRRSKLTVEDVREIRSLLADGFKQKEIASKFKVDQSVISAINTGRLWAGVE